MLLEQHLEATLQARALMRKHRKWFKLFVRCYHTMLNLGIPLSLVTRDSDLKRAIENGNKEFALVYFVAIVVSLATYYVAAYVDPGYIQTGDQDPSQSISNKISLFDDEACDNQMSQPLVETDGQSIHRRCGYCGIQQPLRSHHCHDCGRCVRRFDHHCPWVESCVGEHSHKFYLLWLFTFDAVILWTLKITWRCVFDNTWLDWIIKVNNYFWLLLGLVIVTTLLCFHTYLMCINQTTWELVSRHRITYLKNLHFGQNPFHQGYIKNVLYFLCRCRPKRWEDLYFLNTRTQGQYPGYECV